MQTEEAIIETSVYVYVQKTKSRTPIWPDYAIPGIKHWDSTFHHRECIPISLFTIPGNGVRLDDHNWQIDNENVVDTLSRISFSCKK